MRDSHLVEQTLVARVRDERAEIWYPPDPRCDVRVNLGGLFEERECAVAVARGERRAREPLWCSS